MRNAEEDAALGEGWHDAGLASAVLFTLAPAIDTAGINGGCSRRMRQRDVYPPSRRRRSRRHLRGNLSGAVKYHLGAFYKSVEKCIGQFRNPLDGLTFIQQP